jgi:hypothetical protein
VTRKMLQSRIRKAAKELEYTKLEASSGTVAGRVWRRLGTLRPGEKNGARYRVDTIQEEVRAVRARENWLATVQMGDRDTIVAELKKNAIGAIGFPKTA